MSTWLVREASHSDWAEIHAFFLELDREDRYMYYGVYVSDDVINQNWSNFENRQGDQFFVVEFLGSIVGVCQIVKVGTRAEISVVTKREFRGRGIAHALVERAVVWCKTHEVKDLVMYCLPNNNIIKRIIIKHDLLPRMIAQPAEARFVVPTGKCQDYQIEQTHTWISACLTIWKRCFNFVTHIANPARVFDVSKKISGHQQ